MNPGGVSVRVLDRNSQLLYEVRDADTGSVQTVELSDMAPTFVDAIIAIEDRDFYGHQGVSLKATARALYQNVDAGEVVSGGSTITQQLARNLLKPKRRTYLYKMREAIVALKLDLFYSKEEILGSYLNSSYFGHQAYGIGAAARTFLAKHPRELSLAESAMLAGLVQSPSALDPFVNKRLALERQKRVLTAMRETGVITEAQEQEAKAEPITLSRAGVPIRAPHFSFLVQAAHPELFQQSGEVQTTLDLDLQTEAERIIERNLELLKDRNVTSAAVVVLDVKTGEVLAMVGSADYFAEEHDGAVNVAISARQPGSALKPFTYALALARGDTAATTVEDVEAQFFTQEGNPYIPRNYDYGYHGLVRYREALANSYNIAAVKVLERVGVPTLVEFLRSAGISTLDQNPTHYGLALTLGDAEVTLLDLTSAYALFPRGGKTLEPHIIAGTPPSPGSQILDARVSWLISDILSDDTARLPEFGENSALAFTRSVAAKTGTTRNSRDNWTLGYTTRVAVGVWVGNADNSPMVGTSGVTGAGPIFHDVMEAAAKGHPEEEFPQPQGLKQLTICRLSGKLPTPECPHKMEEWFMVGKEPTEQDDMYRRIAIDTRNGLLASETCPKEFVTEKVMAVFPPGLRTWAFENGWPQPPREYSTLCPPNSSTPNPSSTGGGGYAEGPWLTIIRPQPNDSYKLEPMIPNDSEKIIFRAQADASVSKIEWFVDGAKVGEGIAPDFRFDWLPKVGIFQVEAKASVLKEMRRIEVVE
jgi:penicillin-binding protein 1C